MPHIQGVIDGLRHSSFHGNPLLMKQVFAELIGQTECKAKYSEIQQSFEFVDMRTTRVKPEESRVNTAQACSVNLYSHCRNTFHFLKYVWNLIQRPSWKKRIVWCFANVHNLIRTGGCDRWQMTPHLWSFNVFHVYMALVLFGDIHLVYTFLYQISWLCIIVWLRNFAFAFALSFQFSLHSSFAPIHFL